MTKNRNSAVRRGTSNVFADLGFADPETHLLKAQLVSRVQDVMQDRSLTQTEAARIMSVSQPDVSRMLKGQFRDVSVERLMRMLAKLGCQVDIVVKAQGRRTHTVAINVAAA